MQLMSWMLARLGSRFSLLFEPYRQRVMHSALGRFLDRPLDLMVGLVEPDGTERVLPFTTRGTPLHNPEQFSRLNSITFRGVSEHYRLRYEFNVHSVFYPEEEALCVMPAFYLEMRVNPVDRVRWITPRGRRPAQVKLFLRLNRPDTQISASGEGNGRIDLQYRNLLEPGLEGAGAAEAPGPVDPVVQVQERILSLTSGAVPDADGCGLTYEMPVTDVGSGIKWRLVWAAFCGDPVLQISSPPTAPAEPARFRYVRHWSDLDAVVGDAVAQRDEFLGRSRLFEKAVDQAPLRTSERHLINQSFQNFLANTFWCERSPGTPGSAPGATPASNEWFSVWEGSTFQHSTLDVEYNTSLFYLTICPRLLELQFDQWARACTVHAESGGRYMAHDLGRGCRVGEQAYPHAMPVEENANFLLLAHVHAHWSGETRPLKRHADLIEQLADYLLWTDRDGSGFPSEGVASTVADGGPAVRIARKQTYLAVKRLAALRAAADLLRLAGRPERAERYAQVVQAATPKIESQAWLDDHYAVCLDASAAGLSDMRSGEPLPYEQVPGWDGYSIYTGNGLLLPALCGQPPLLRADRLAADIHNATRETAGPYGCSHTTADVDTVWTSQNLWRDFVARYLGSSAPTLSQTYWDLQAMSNTGQQSLGFCDTYINNNLTFYPRGVASLGYLVAYPRLVIDRLAPGGAQISINPDRFYPQRWPLFPLADWKAGKIPVCVVDMAGRISVENESDPIAILGD